MQEEVRINLSNYFGLIFDAWSEGGEHFVAVFASYAVDDRLQTPLLSFCPLLDSEDLTAESFRDLFAVIMDKFHAYQITLLIFLATIVPSTRDSPICWAFR